MKKQMKIVVSVLLVLCMLMPLATTVFATGVEPAAQQQNESKVDYYDGTPSTTTKFTDATSGTVTIDSAAEFVAFAQASKEKDFAGVTVLLTKDLVFNTGNAVDWNTSAPAYTSWTSIGASGAWFKGIFDGDGHTISGIYINNTTNTWTGGVFESFGSGAVIKDLAIVNSYIKSTKDYLGVMAARSEGTNATISGCYVNAIVDGTATNVNGGFVGLATSKNLIIDNSVFAGVIYATSGGKTGGFIGSSGQYDNHKDFYSTISNCVNLGSLKVGGNWTAALIGTATKITLTNSMNYGYSLSSTGKEHALLGAFRKHKDATTLFNLAVSDCYLFSDMGQTTLTGDDADGVTAPVLNTHKNDISYSIIDSSTLIGKLPVNFTNVEENAEPTYFPNWTARSGRLPMPSTAYANFAKYIDLYDGGASSFINDDITKYIYTAQYYGNSIKKTPTKTFDIDCEDELVAFSKAANAGWFATNANGYTFNLTRDMVFNEGNAEAWQTQPPTYTWTPINSFRGTFNGQGHTISGLYMKTTGHAGLFGQLKENAQVRNLGIVNSYFENTATDGAGTIGAIAGRIMAPSVVVDGCYANAIVRSGSKAGGLIGVVSGTAAAHDSGTAAVVSNCAFFGSVYAKQTEKGTWGGTAGSSVAGIVGHTAGGASANFNDLKIINCVNFGTITNESIVGNGIYSAAAGILGFAEDGKFEITSCFNFGETTGPTGTARYTNNNALIGQARNDAAVIFVMTDCYIFSDLGQNLFNSTSQPVCNYIKYTINGVTNEQDDNALDDPSTEGVNEGELAQTDSNHINQILTTSASTWTVANSDRVKTVLPFTNGGAWSTRTSCIGSEYPLPTSVYLNFFKVDLKYVQSTDVNNGTYSVRIISEIDSLNYNRAGFKVKVTLENGSSKTLDTMAIKVFKTVVDKDYEAVTAREGKYFVALTLTDMPTTARTYEFTPYTIGDSGEYSYGTTMVLTFDANGVCTDANDEYEYTVV